MKIIAPKWIIPVEPENVVLENQVIVIDQDKIVEILPEKESHKYHPDKKIILNNHVVMPGLINMHAHSPMTLFRGLADDLALMDWLENHIWPAEKKWLSDEFCYDGTRVAILEMIRGGTTFFNDNFFFLHGIGKAVDEMGMRASLGACVLDFETAFGKCADDYLVHAEEMYKKYKNHSLMSMTICPHAPYTVSDETFLKVKKFAEKNNVFIQIHLHEAKRDGIERLRQLGILSNRMQAVHMVHCHDEDIKLLKESGTHVIHCPESNLKLASGFCPVKKLMDADVNVALGTDGAASNNDLDMFGEMKTAAMLAKAVSGDATALNALQAIKMATLNGAKAMGLDQQLGSLTPGKFADMIAINLSEINTQPVYNPISQVVYAVNSQQVTDVWVAGKQLLKNKEFVGFDEKEIMARAQAWGQKLKQS